jgi:hypothetical protein
MAGWNHSGSMTLSQSDEELLGAVYGLILVG